MATAPAGSPYRHDGQAARRPFDRVQTRLVNPVVGVLLRTPLHDLISGGVLLLHVTGRVSGRIYRVPARYCPDGDGLLLISRRSRTWWRNLDGGAPVSLVLRGRRRTGYATVSTVPHRVLTALWAIAATTGAGHDDGRPPIPVEEAVAITIRLDPPADALGTATAEAAATTAPAKTAKTNETARIRRTAGTAEAPEPPARPGRAFWRRWFAAVTLGEILGFAVPALVAPLTMSLGFGGLAEATAIVLAGVAEGSVLGLAQAYALRTALPGVGSREWAMATAGGAAIAWLIGSLPIILGERLLDLNPVLLAVLGLTLLASMGALQWRILRRHVRHAFWWIPATAASWLAALAAFAAVTTPLWREDRPPWLVAAIGVLGGVVMAAVVAALTGLALLRLLRTPRRGHG